MCKTLAELYALAEEQDDGEHRVWAGCTHQGVPKVKFGGRPITAYRAVYCVGSGSSLEDIDRLRIWPTCGVDHCVTFEHLRLGLKVDFYRWRKKRGLEYKSPAARASITVGKRMASAAGMTIEKARAIRLDQRSGNVVGAEYGISRSMVHLIKNNKAWRETVAAASIFSLSSGTANVGRR